MNHPDNQADKQAQNPLDPSVLPIKITLIGAGGVATNLGRLFNEQGRGVEITQLLGRSEKSTSVLAEKLNCPYILSADQLTQKADLYIVSITDREIKGLLPKIHIPAASMIVHTAGGVSIDIFKGYFENYGVLYPLQSLRKETSVIARIPFYLDSNNRNSKAILENFAWKAALDYRWADDHQRMQLHIAAVFCSNFPNYLYTLAEDFCTRQGLDFTSVLPVIEETANRLGREGLHPATLQTGPAIRQDIPTTEQHAALLVNDPEAAAVYQYMTQRIMESPLFKQPTK
ncbi:Predicted oxidoreductase, contains short-chain dehydrogenase (SDR) and DUF2520 domains [Arachidicoccus rhizosphaerae]|uniref:Predicted oxidoreductase, contains short-chain dehydrogenase (SDR) and DUF2520 domains n=1 Tax=Arachidicoccus rhizosphaerae TaxID=551991 RepID=A0A1H3WN75_9BACT|nr:Rossmann-like and DUF2520 domain-containing protein [Arachidicoccus rhizosphaerae]SDZ88586.1 Predicted oxidoreductase, contains short-chain dehydrogenase (SDR) and DUF2520 domains [Arachidicoccus rhizosphaerae]